MQTVSHFLGNCSLTSSLFGVLDATDILSILLNSNSTGCKQQQNLKTVDYKPKLSKCNKREIQQFACQF